MVSQLSDLNLGTILVTMPKSEQGKNTQVIDNEVVGDTGFEPVTSTVCKRQTKKAKRELLGGTSRKR